MTLGSAHASAAVEAAIYMHGMGWPTDSRVFLGATEAALPIN
jgi:hypothetical protein